jgi:hypothetical protein
MAMGFINGQMEASSKVLGKKIKSLVMVFTIGKMVESMKAIGYKIICMVKVIINGLMEENTMDHMLMIKKRAMEFIIIQMEDVTKVNGKQVSNMVRVFL